MRKKNFIDMWYGDKFISKKYNADVFFYPHGSFGYSYRGNIYDDLGNFIGDYGTNNSIWIQKNLKIKWKEDNDVQY